MYRYDRRAASHDLGTILTYTEGEGFSARTLYSMKTDRGYVSVVPTVLAGKLRDVTVLKRAGDPPGDAQVAAPGIRKGQKIEDLRQLRALPVRSVIRANRFPQVLKKVGDDTWEVVVVNNEDEAVGDQYLTQHLDGMVFQNGSYTWEK